MPKLCFSLTVSPEKSDCKKASLPQLVEVQDSNLLLAEIRHFALSRAFCPTTIQWHVQMVLQHIQQALGDRHF